MAIKSREKFKYLENEKSLYDEIKNIFYHLSSRAYFDFFVEGKRPTLITLSH